MKPTLTIIAACLLLATGIVHGEDAVVSVRTIPPASSLEPGKTTVLSVELVIAAPYHINSDHPLQDYLIPTTLEFEPLPGVKFGKAVFPAAPEKKLPFSDAPMAVYEGTVKVTLEITPASDLKSREIRLNGKVRYQACNDQYCLRPAVQGFSLTLPVSPGTKTAELPPGSAVASQTPIPPASAKPEDPYPEDFGSKGLLVTFVFVFLGGLALNLTPCVYPMIPITITYFGGQAQGKKGGLVAHSFLYVIGMAVTYSILGVAAAMTGGLFGSAHQYPPVLIGIALVMVLLALSMFDVYELRMPQALNRLAGSSQKGFGGTFLMGLTVGIVAAPCIGPFVLGLLTYVGNRGSAVLGFALFFVLALGLGVPFLFLGAFSGSIRRLPRSGAWMVWVRKIFGFILLAMAVHFLKPLFPSLLAYHCTLAMMMLLAGIYLAWIDTVPESGKLFSYVRNAAGILFFGAALYYGVTGLESYLGNAQARPATGAVQWLPYSDAALSRASRESKPVFIDFYADWCAPCKELDSQTYSAPEVVSRSGEFIMVKVDLTSADDPQAEFLRKKYQARGVPTLVFLTPDGREIAELRGTGFESKDVFLEKMNRALGISAGR
jgi:thioredoxin:protein disulfide reductase